MHSNPGMVLSNFPEPALDAIFLLFSSPPRPTIISLISVGLYRITTALPPPHNLFIQQEQM